MQALVQTSCHTQLALVPQAPKSAAVVTATKMSCVPLLHCGVLLQANLRNRGLFSEQGCLVAFASNLAGELQLLGCERSGWLSD
jgi:hypothetical protein